MLSTFSKILERAVHNRVSNFLHSQNLLYKSQYGFRTNHSTEHALIEIQNTIIQNLKNNKITAGIFLDLSKAFDCIDHTILLTKLENYGIRGTSLKWFESYLSNRYQYVVLNKSKSQTITIDTGVPQGTILGPLLFIIYMNDLTTNCGSLISFADDTTLLYSNTNFKMLETIINQDLIQISNWLILNKLNLNTTKTKLLVFHKETHQQNNLNLEIVINNTKIEQCLETNFLGVTLQNNLKWNKHNNKICNKLSQINYFINKIKHRVPCQILTLIYNSIILPHINYGIISWFKPNSAESKRLNTIQKKIVRNLKCAKYNSHTDPIFKQLRLLKVEDIFKLKGALIYLKTLTGNTSDFLQTELQLNNIYHTHNTRQAQLVHFNHVTSNYDKQSINYKIHHIIYELKNNIYKNKSLYTNKVIIKTHLLTRYNSICDIQNCYICNT